MHGNGKTKIMATNNITTTTSVPVNYNSTTGAISGHYLTASNGITYTNSNSAYYTTSYYGSRFSVTNDKIVFYDGTGKEMVHLSDDGKVIWNGNIQIDAAAEAFGNALNLGAELSAGITENTKINVRNMVFDEIIKVAEEEGPLSAQQLTFMLRSCKIVDKLKGKI